MVAGRAMQGGSWCWWAWECVPRQAAEGPLPERSSGEPRCVALPVWGGQHAEEHRPPHHGPPQRCIRRHRGVAERPLPADVCSAAALEERVVCQHQPSDVPLHCGQAAALSPLHQHNSQRSPPPLLEGPLVYQHCSLGEMATLLCTTDSSPQECAPDPDRF